MNNTRFHKRYQNWDNVSAAASRANKGKPKPFEHRMRISEGVKLAWQEHDGKVLESIKCGP